MNPSIIAKRMAIVFGGATLCAFLLAPFMIAVLLAILSLYAPRNEYYMYLSTFHVAVGVFVAGYTVALATSVVSKGAEHCTSLWGAFIAGLLLVLPSVIVVARQGHWTSHFICEQIAQVLALTVAAVLGACTVTKWRRRRWKPADKEE